jgi:hypothetical protein
VEALKSGVGPTTVTLAVPAVVRTVDGTVAVIELVLFHTELSVVGDPEGCGVQVTVDPLARLVPAMVRVPWLMPMLAVAPVARVLILVMTGGVPAISDAEAIEAVRTVGFPVETVVRAVPLNEIFAPELNPVPFTVSVSAALRLAVV